MKLIELLRLKGVQYGLFAAVALAVCVELLFVFDSAHRLASSKEVLLGRDDDAAVLVEATSETTWTNDVEAPYGPLYYRISASLQKLVPSVLLANGEASDARVTSKRYHFSLMLVSVLSFLCFVGIIAKCLDAGWVERIAIFGLFVLLLFHYEVWTTYVFRAHPELFLTGLIAAATLFSLKVNLYGSRLRSRSFYLAAVFFGLACATKPSAGAFAAGYFMLLLLPYSTQYRFFNPRRLIETAAAVTVMLATYFIVGAPRTFYLFSKLSDASDFVGSKSQEFSLAWIGSWMGDFSAYLFPVVLLVFIAALLFDRGQRLRASSPKIIGNTFASALIFLMPLLIILKTQLVIPTRHYMLSIVASFVVAQTFLQVPYVVAVRALVEKRLTRHKGKKGSPAAIVRLLSVAVVAIVIIFAKGTAESADRAVTAQLACIPEAKAMLARIIEKRGSVKGKMAVTPYFPCPAQHRCRQMWGMTADRIQRFRPRFLGIGYKYANRFIGEVSDYDKHNREDWRLVKAFHELFHNKRRVRDMYKNEWKLLLKTDVCGFELWERTNK